MIVIGSIAAPIGALVLNGDNVDPLDGLKGKDMIVTGGAGFIGSNLVDRLVSNGNRVFVIDNMHTGSPNNLVGASKTGRVQVIKDDVKNIAKHGIKADVVFHLGMYSASPMYRDNPNLVNEVVEGMINLLEYAKANKVPIVYASTSSIYNGLKPPHREEMTPFVTDFYTEARYATERLAELYSKLHGVNVSAMRFFSVYGRHEEAKQKYANLVTQFFWAMRKGEQPVIYGDGEQRRDFVHVDDVVDALLLASSAKGFNVFNVGTGKNYSLNELIEKLNKAMGTSIRAKYVGMPVKNYVMETLADTSKSEKMLSFRARISLDEGISKVVRGA